MKKKIFTALLTFAMIAALAACGKSNGGATGTDSGSATADSTATESTTDTGDTESGGSTGIANPFVDCGTLDEAASLAGFTLEAPDSIEGYDGKLIQAIEKEMIQVIYGDVNDQNADTIYVRKGAGSEDISGDYNEYADEEQIEVADGVSATAKGHDDKYYVVTWTDGNYTYAIDADGGMDLSTASSIASQVK